LIDVVRVLLSDMSNFPMGSEAADVRQAAAAAVSARRDARAARKAKVRNYRGYHFPNITSQPNFH